MMPSEQRLHPATLIFDLVKHIKNFAVPGVLVLLGASRSSGGPGGIFDRVPSGWETWLFVLLVPAAIMSVFRYLSCRILYDDSELVIRSGLVFRNERHVPYARIQNVDAVQNPLHRLFGVVEVRVETGGGKEEEARLSVLSLAAFDRMRRHVLSGRTANGRANESGGGNPPGGGNPLGLPLAQDAADIGEPLVHLSLREVLLCGLLENKGMVLVGAAAGVAWEANFFGGSSWRVFGVAESMGYGVFRNLLRAVFADGPLPLLQIAGAVAFVAGALVLIRVLSMAWALVRLYDFRLTRVDNDLRSTFGLFTRVATTVPIRRVHTVIVSASPLHRWLKRVTVRVETAGGVGPESGATKVREWLAPLLHAPALPALLQHVLPGVNVDALDWQPLHPRAFARAVKPNLIVTTLIIAGTAVVIGWGAIGVAMLLMPWTIVSARQYVAHVGWAQDDEVVAMRTGWLWQRLTIARVNKIQAVAMRESPFDRRAAMARVRVDTAGAGELSRIDIPYLDGAVARSLHGRLAAHAANTAFKW